MSDMELYRHLGLKVAECRAKLGLTQEKVAGKIGLSRASLANIESGRQRVMLHQLYALANAFGLKSILDLVPATWTPMESLPELVVSGTALTPREQSDIQDLLASAMAKVGGRKRQS